MELHGERPLPHLFAGTLRSTEQSAVQFSGQLDASWMRLFWLQATGYLDLADQNDDTFTVLQT